MSKKRRNILIIGFILLIVLFIASAVLFGTGSPFGDSAILSSLGGGNLRQTLFGDNVIKLGEINTDCDILADKTFDVSDNCSIQIDGSEEEVRFDTPRDLRLTMCWGDVTVNMSNAAEKIEVEDAIIPTDRNAETLTFNIFKEGDSELDIDCESDQCLIAINNTDCPVQPEISRNSIATAGCTINSANQIIFRQNCVLTVNTTDFEDDNGNDNPIFFDKDNRPRVITFDYCQGDILFNAASDEEKFTLYKPISMPDNARHREIDIYGEDTSTMTLLCITPPQPSPTPNNFAGTSSETPACMVVISHAGCFP